MLIVIKQRIKYLRVFWNSSHTFKLIVVFRNRFNYRTNKKLSQKVCTENSDVVSVICFGVRVSVMFHFMFVQYSFSSVLVAEWPTFGK